MRTKWYRKWGGLRQLGPSWFFLFLYQLISFFFFLLGTLCLPLINKSNCDVLSCLVSSPLSWLRNSLNGKAQPLPLLGNLKVFRAVPGDVPTRCPNRLGSFLERVAALLGSPLRCFRCLSWRANVSHILPLPQQLFSNLLLAFQPLPAEGLHLKFRGANLDPSCFPLRCKLSRRETEVRDR